MSRYTGCLGFILVGLLALSPVRAGGARPALVWVFGDLPEALSWDAPHEEVRRGADLSVAVPRRHARPGDRWIDILIAVHPRDRRPEFTVLAASLYSLDDPGRPVAEARAARQPGWARFDERGRPTEEGTGRALLRVNLRDLALERARLRIELEASQPGGAILAVEEILLSALPPERPLEPGERIPIRVDLPDGIESVREAPVMFGMPFPAGALWDADRVRLVDASGREIPSLREITGRWAEDGAIRWLRFDALADSETNLFVEASPPEPVPEELPGIRIAGRDAADGSLVLDTGAARFVLGVGRSPVRAVYRGQERIAAAGPRGLYVIDQHGRVATAGGDNRMQVEVLGPLAASLRFEGFYRTVDGEALARHITRIELYAGQPDARVTHTLILTRDTNEVWFREVGWDFHVEPGEEPQALLAVSREEWEAVDTVALDASVESVWILQADHVRFGGGEQRFEVGLRDAGGRETVRHTGTTMGDWAALAGSVGGLALHCREAARQHPKEFELRAGRLTLKLFSDRAGEVLDFRPDALAERWNRGGRLVAGCHRLEPLGAPRGQHFEHLVRAMPNNAIGWSKTHHLSIQVLPARNASAAGARHGRLHSRQIYALADPAWLYETRALGPLYPRDPERFPTAEAFIEAAFEPYYARGHERDQQYGFIDYFAGPHYRSLGHRRYNTSTYTVRPSAWLLYARSGERRLREWAEGTNRTWMDGNIAHWDDPASNRICGLFTADGPTPHSWAPYYWGASATATGKGDGQSSPDQFLYEYQLTGYRRAAEVLEQLGEGIKRHLIPWRHTWSRFQVLRSLNAVYTLTWDPLLRMLIEEYAARFYDPESAVGVHRDVWPHRQVLYKTPEHMPIPIVLWEQFGDARFRDMALGWGRANYYGLSYADSRLGFDPLRGRFEKGLTGYFLYRETGQPHLLEEMLVAVQRSIPGRSQSISSINWDLRGIVYGLALIAESGVDRESRAAWLAYDDSAAEGSIRLFVRKDEEQSLVLHSLRASAVHPEARPHFAHANLVSHPPHGLRRLTVHKDAAAGEYELLVSGERGYNFVFSDQRHPLVLQADGPWQPAPVEAAQYPTIFFLVPAGSKAPRIHFEGQARLVTPAGHSWQEGDGMSGWVDLPADQPGLWGFEPVDNRPVVVDGIPPYFAFRDPAYHFIPDPDAPEDGRL